MFKQLFLATISLLANSISFGQVSTEDYRVYSAIIKSEIRDSTKSVAIIKNCIDSTEKSRYTCSMVNNLTSKNYSDQYQAHMWTENSQKQRPSVVDSTTTQFLIDYCKSSIERFVLTNNFNQAYKTIIINKTPIRRKSVDKDWKKFYGKYPYSGGIFSFSEIKYYTLDNIAIVYYWIMRGGLNGHGTIAILKKINDKWQMEYRIYLWHA